MNRLLYCHLVSPRLGMGLNFKIPNFETVLDPEKEYLIGFYEKTEKLQSEFEWKLERLALLKIRPSESSNYTPDEIKILAKEELELIEWLKDNQPADWQTLTMKNAKEGLHVKLHDSKNLHLIEHICEDGGRIILYCKTENTSFLIVNLNRYEINLAEKSDCLPEEG